MLWSSPLTPRKTARYLLVLHSLPSGDDSPEAKPVTYSYRYSQAYAKQSDFAIASPRNRSILAYLMPLSCSAFKP
ncbi:hypothetical protein [Coleofasciculus sp. B1-GNL1-01]|uniref:hypothetical protein n=1 Tax=Coleofasciculus sp. B1-GNL1-01 TaxID=3068484 RepID=UPI0040635247